LRLHWPKHAEQRLLILRPNLEFVERADQIFNQRVEIRFRDAHALVRGLHVLSGVLAWATACFANLVNELPLERRKPRRIGSHPGKEAIDALVGRDAPNKFINNRGYGRFAPPVARKASSAVELQA